MAGLYLHIPFCAQRCTYCDFYFVTTAKSYTPFVQALLAEITHYGHTHGRREPVDTIYFGGGTPSLLPADDLGRILDALHANFDTANLRETTLELNPGDVTEADLRDLRTLGIDRLSIGIQSFFEPDLRWMNRSHSAEEAEAIIPMAQAAGFENFTVDLIFGLPDQPFEYWGANLEKAVRLGVPHLSTYSLTVEPRTVLAKQVALGKVHAPDEDVQAERYRFTMDYLRSRGYEHYEVSSFAMPGFRAVHNSAYWTHANYIGFGPSAHSLWWKTGSIAERWANVRNLRQYEALLAQRELPLDGRELLGLDELADEYVLLRLRTADGLDLHTLEFRYGVDLLDEKADEIAALEADGLLRVADGAVRLTDEGFLLCDSITARLLG